MAGFNRIKDSINIFVDISGIDSILASTDWIAPEGRYLRGVLITTSGNLKYDYIGGHGTTLPISVASNSFTELRGHAITKIYKTGTTCAGISGLL